MARRTPRASTTRNALRALSTDGGSTAEDDAEIAVVIREDGAGCEGSQGMGTAKDSRVLYGSVGSGSVADLYGN
jgi:hypothetical protein